MIKAICKLLFRINGWQFKKGDIGNLKKFVLVAAPHTSNWDFVYAVAAFELMGIPVRFTIKKEWMKFPFKKVMESLGAIPIDRERGADGKPVKGGTVKAMAKLFEEREELVVLVTPEGTRKPVTKWKTGFYYVALAAKAPLVMGYIDYENKITGVDKVIYPSGDINKDMHEVMAFFSGTKPKFKENFKLDSRYA